MSGDDDDLQLVKALDGNGNWVMIPAVRPNLNGGYTLIQNLNPNQNPDQNPNPNPNQNQVNGQGW
jgi:hypothetical protein